MNHSTPKRYYIILATHRTGSNLLCRGLNDLNIAGHPGEFFMHVDTIDGPDPTLFGKPAEEFTKLMYQSGTTDNGVFGIKTMWQNLESAFNYYHQQGYTKASTPFALFNELFPAAKYIYIRREDKIRQAVSLVKAMKTGYYTSIQQDQAEVQSYSPNNIEYDEMLLHKVYQRLKLEDEQWDALIHKNSIQALRINYEEFTQNYESSIREALRFIGIESWSNAVIKSNPLRKQADNTNEEWVRRFKHYLSEQ